MQRQGNHAIPIEDLGVQIHPEIASMANDIVSWRRQLHEHPELGFEEKWTSQFVAEKLRSFGGIEVVEGIGQTGVVGMIIGAHPGPCIGLRADMDALPLQEGKSEFNDSYISKQKGRMHGCGHDGHTAMLLAAAKVLTTKRKYMRGSVKLIFQPNEENVCGARAQIKDGVMEAGRTGHKIDQVYGIHLIAAMPTGVVGVTDGPLMAASDRLKIVIEGPGGHGGMAAGVPDTIVAASQLVSQLQTIVSRNIVPTEAAVVSICYIHAGDGGYNVMPSRLEMRGTVRNFSEEVQMLLQKRIEELCSGVASSFNVKITPEYEKVAPCTNNNSKEHVQYIREASQKVVGKDRVGSFPPLMGAEDFSEFLLRAPGCFIFVGANLFPQPGDSYPIPKQDTTAHHSPTFDFDERSLLIGPSIFLNLTQKLLFPTPSKL